MIECKINDGAVDLNAAGKPTDLVEDCLVLIAGIYNSLRQSDEMSSDAFRFLIEKFVSDNGFWKASEDPSLEKYKKTERNT